jgi:hypothetical protein
VVFTYPEDQASTWEPLKAVLTRSLRAGDDLKAQ